MTAVWSFRYLYLVSRVFGIFPYNPLSGKEFRYSERIVNQGRCVLALLIIFRLVVVTLDLKYNINTNVWKFSTFFRSTNTLYLNFLTIIVYRNIFKYSKLTCEWLRRMNNLYSMLKGNVRGLSASNLFLVSYSLIFFSITNFLTITGFIINNKFLNGHIAKWDALSFGFLLALQNVYICQFLTFLQLINHSFTRINEILEDGELQRLRGKNLKNKLKKLRVHHLIITEFFYFVNSTFELFLLFYIFWSFCTTVFCFVSIAVFDLDDALTFMMWASYHPCQNYPMLYLCESVSAESKKSAHSLNVLMIQNDNPDVKEEVEIFSLQIQHRPTDFNVCGFFHLNYKLVIALSGVIATYIITLIQIQPTHIIKINETLPQF